MGVYDVKFKENNPIKSNSKHTTEAEKPSKIRQRKTEQQLKAQKEQKDEMKRTE